MPFPKVLAQNETQTTMSLSLLGILFVMRFLNLSINLIVDFCPHLGSSCFVSLRFGQISPLSVFRELTVTLDRNAES